MYYTKPYFLRSSGVFNAYMIIKKIQTFYLTVPVKRWSVKWKKQVSCLNVLLWKSILFN